MEALWASAPSDGPLLLEAGARSGGAEVRSRFLAGGGWLEVRAEVPEGTDPEVRVAVLGVLSSARVSRGGTKQ